MHPKQYKKLGFDSIHDLENFLNREDVKQMVGDNYDHYRELWLSNYAYGVMNEPKTKVKGKTNWLAIVASPIVWLAYRRMYAPALGFVATLVALVFCEQYFDFSIGSGMGGAMLVLAFMSKDMYFDHIVRCTRKIDAMPNQERVDQFLKWRKGTSILFAVMVVPIFIALCFGALVLGAELSGNPL